MQRAIFCLVIFFCSCALAWAEPSLDGGVKPFKLAIDKTEDYIPFIENRRLAVVANQTSLFSNGTHLIDSLLERNIKIEKIFALEHGYKGKIEAGGLVSDVYDTTNRLKVVSLYGNHKKPNREDMEGIDVVLFDIQDVGLRFYTYISSLSYIMASCKENNVEIIVLDRPNPNIDKIDGPVLQKDCRSFVGLHPIPILYGMTIGEFAVMINELSWIDEDGGFESFARAAKDFSNTTKTVGSNHGSAVAASPVAAQGSDQEKTKARLKIIPMDGYHRAFKYLPPVAPSPNLNSSTAIYAYASLCLFEGTEISVGRGTYEPFRVYGFEGCTIGNYSFFPKSIADMAQNPPYKDRECRGFRIEDEDTAFWANGINLEPILKMYEVYPNKSKFFNSFFDKLSGNKRLREQIESGLSQEEIKKTWQADLEVFKALSKEFYIYK